MLENKKILKSNFGQLTDEELNILLSYFEDEKLNKNDFFTKTGKYCKKLSFVKSGMLRVFTIANDKEITQWITTENYFITEISSFFFDSPSKWSIQTLSEVELLTINKESYKKLCKDFPKWNEIEKQFIAKCFGILEQRVFTFLSMDSRERYHLFFEQNKELFNKVPLQYLASIIGMSPETFSRIRKENS